MSDGTDVKRIFDPLFKVTLPGYMKESAGSPQKDDSDVSKVGRKNLLVKIFFGHAIMGFKVVGGSNPVPNTTGCRVLGEVLAKFGEFSCHSYKQKFSCSLTIEAYAVFTAGYAFLSLFLEQLFQVIIT
jgi:hypothetical protein